MTLLLAVLLPLLPVGIVRAAEPATESILPKRDMIPGERVTLKGKDYPVSPADVKVVIGDRYIVKPTFGVTPDTLIFEIPNEAAAPAHYGIALLIASGQTIKQDGNLHVVSSELRIAPDTRLPETMPGQPVRVNGTDLPEQRGNIVVSLDTRQITPDEATATSFTFRVPSDMPPGRYVVRVETTGEPRRNGTVPGELRVLPKGAPKITAVTPLTGYPGDGHRFSFEVTGENFSTTAGDNEIRINGSAIQDRKDDECIARPEADKKFDHPCVYAGPEGRTLSVYGYKTDGGQASVQVLSYGGQSEKQPILFARIPRGLVLPFALAGSIAIAVIVITIVWKGIGRYRIDGENYRPFSLFFLDKATNTFSLSKFQLFAWTAAAVFGYLYLLVANLLIQWKFAFPDLPDGLPLLMGISAGTTVTAIGITNQFGGKGSGPVRPSMADFVTSGGLVTPERFQFFVWTIVGIIGFISLLLAADPSTLNALPKLPDNFVTIMGISAAAYLGGKAVRKAGPVIKSFSIKAVTNAGDTPPGENLPVREPASQGPYLTLNLKGDSLDTKGTIKLDDMVLRTDQFWITPRAVPDPPGTTSGELDVTLDAGLINGADPQFLFEGEHTLALVNSDGQSSAIRFPSDALAIAGIEPSKLPASSTSKVVTITGSNFAGEMTAKWKPAGATIEGDTGAVTLTDATRASVTVADAGSAGEAVLTLVSKLGLRASKPVTVVDPPTISRVDPNPVTASTQNVVLTITGTNLTGGEKVSWTSAGSVAATDEGQTQKRAGAQEVSVKIANAGPAGAATLTLTNELGAVASSSVNVQ